jgi:hypothetical protein
LEQNPVIRFKAKKGGTPTDLGLLERASFDDWTSFMFFKFHALLSLLE